MPDPCVVRLSNRMRCPLRKHFGHALAVMALLHAAAYRNTRDHLLRVLASTLSGSDVQRITAANGSGSLADLCPRRCNAR